MARIRKSEIGKTVSKQIIWKIGKYIRLFCDDGNIVSESVVNQDKILSDEIPSFFEDNLYEIVDTYIDDGTSGTTEYSPVEKGPHDKQTMYFYRC